MGTSRSSLEFFTDPSLDFIFKLSLLSSMGFSPKNLRRSTHRRITKQGWNWNGQWFERVWNSEIDCQR
jgi:hypothetical protein